MKVNNIRFYFVIFVTKWKHQIILFKNRKLQFYIKFRYVLVTIRISIFLSKIRITN